MNEEEFRTIVEHAWDTMPAKFKERIQNVALLIEDEPSEEVRKQEKLEEGETLLGLYHGIPETARGELYGVGATLPDTITLYRLPLLEEAYELIHERNLALDAALEEAVRETLWHEVGHYFGLDEHHVREREDDGTNRFK
jgi:predicted Zn-dependent protease with MMP-like domain